MHDRHEIDDYVRSDHWRWLIVGANSLVTKNIPFDIIATRMAAKVVKAAERETIIGEQQN